MSSRVFEPRASIQRLKRPADRIHALSQTPPRVIRSPSPALFRPQPQHLPPVKKGSPPCKVCGSTETEEGDGNLVCKGCGLVLSNGPTYTNDITFEEGSNGRIQQSGQRVIDGQTHQKSFAPRGVGGGPGHEATPAGDKAKTEATGVIRRYAMLLRIDEREVNMGRRIFEMAYNRGFVRGRTIESVAIVSLYIATRRAKDRQPLYDLMLIDFAEQAGTNVFDMGKMMQDLIKKLYLNPDGSMSKDDHFYLQAHGAEVLIDKFVNHLDFGPDANKIKTDATRILQRMKRDWLHHGRRPSGVCGAAVILAARMNNYRRTLREVVLVAKVTEITVSKRLEEFKETESSGLSVNDFRDDSILDSISSMDPPAFYRAFLPPKKKGKKRGRPSKKGLVTAAELEGSDTESHVSIQDDDDDTEQDEDEEEEQQPAKRARVDADGFAVPAVPARSSQASQDNIDPSLQQLTANTPGSQPARRGPGRLKGSKNWVAPPATPEELAYEEELTTSMQQELDNNRELESIDQFPTPSATQTSTSSSQATPPAKPTQPQHDLPIRIDPAECDPKKGPPGPPVNTNIGNTGTISLDTTIAESEFDSDPEVSTCLLSEPERLIKEKIWVTENAEWLRQDHAKRIRRELKDRHLREQGIDPDELRKNSKNNLRKRKDGARRSGRIGDVSYLHDEHHQQSAEGDAQESTAEGRRPSAASMTVKAMMKQRGTYSRRINYDNLVKAYEYPVSSSPSPSPSVDRSVREDSIVSVSSSGTASGRETIGPIFAPFKGRRRPSRPSRTRTPAGPARNARSPAVEVEDSPTPEVEASARKTSEPEPVAQPQQGDKDVQYLGESSASPLSSTHTPLGVGTLGSSGPGAAAPARIDRSMYGNVGKVAGVANKVADETEEADDEDEDDEEEDDDADEEDEDDDDGNDEDDLDEVFAGNFKERPIWEGEDEVVEE